MQIIQTFVLLKQLMRLQPSFAKTTKFSLRVVTEFAPQIQNGYLEKRRNCYISAVVSPISTKFCMLRHIGPLNPKRCSKNQIFKNPRWRPAAEFYV